VRNLRLVFGVIGALVPIGYCGYLVYYFLDISGSVQGAKAIGLGPTLLGLTFVGLLFFIVLIIRIVRIFAKPGSPSSGRRPDQPPSDGGPGFDADAVVARYLARRSGEAASGSPASSPAPDSNSGPARRPSFGRKMR
jgi:hypothetical protein